MRMGRMRFRLGCSAAGAGTTGAGTIGAGAGVGAVAGAGLGRRRAGEETGSSEKVPERARATAAMAGERGASAGRGVPSSPGANERTLQKPSREATRTWRPSGVHARSVIAARCSRRAAATACHACVSYTTTASSDATANTILYGNGTAGAGVASDAAPAPGALSRSW